MNETHAKLQSIMTLHAQGILSPDSTLRACSKLADVATLRPGGLTTADPSNHSEHIPTQAQALTPRKVKRAPPLQPTPVLVEEPPPKKKAQRTLAFYGAREFKKTSRGEWTEAKLECTVQDPVPSSMKIQCPWCSASFKSEQSLGSHKKFAHAAACEAAKRAGTVAIDPEAGPIDMQVINLTMLLIGNLESEVGKWCGARKLNERTGKVEPYDGDKKKPKGGAARRVFVPVWLQLRAIRLCDEFVKQQLPDPQTAAAESFGISTSSMSRYMQPERRKQIEAACQQRAQARKVIARRKVPDKFELATKSTLEQMKARRAKGIRVGPRWLRATYKRAVQENYDNMQSRCFKCSESFLRKFRKRHNIGIRRRTNTKKKSPEELKPALQRMHVGFKLRVLRDGRGKSMFSATEGSWRVADRFSIDQVPFSIFSIDFKLI